MKLSKNFKFLKANSLVESVIAIAIISICILVAFLIYLNVVKQNKSIYYYEAKHKVEMLYHESITNGDYENEDYVYKNYVIEKLVNTSEKENITRLDFKIKITNKSYLISKVVALDRDEKN